MVCLCKQMSLLVSNSAISSLLSGQDNIVRIIVLILGYFLGPYFGYLPTDANILTLGAAAMFMPTAMRSVKNVIVGTGRKIGNTFSPNVAYGLGIVITAASALFLLYARTSLLPTVVSEGIKQLLASGSNASKDAFQMAEASLSYCLGLLGITGANMSWISASLHEWMNNYGFDRVFNPEVPQTLWQNLASAFKISSGTSAGAPSIFSAGVSGLGTVAAVTALGASNVVAGLATGLAVGAIYNRELITALFSSVKYDTEPHFIFVTIAKIMSAGKEQNIASAFFAQKQRMLALIQELAESVPGSAAATAAYRAIVAATNVDAIMKDDKISVIVKVFAMIKVWMVDASQFVIGKIQHMFPAATVPIIATGFAFIVAAIGAALYLRSRYANKGKNIDETQLLDLARAADVTKTLAGNVIELVGQNPMDNNIGSLSFLIEASRIVSQEPNRSVGTKKIMANFENLGRLAISVSQQTTSPRQFVAEFGATLTMSANELGNMASKLKSDADESGAARITALMEQFDFWFQENEMLTARMVQGEKVVVNKRPLFDRTDATLAAGTLQSNGVISNLAISPEVVASKQPRAAKIAAQQSIRRASKITNKKLSAKRLTNKRRLTNKKKR